jgi:hypothetical protein
VLRGEDPGVGGWLARMLEDARRELDLPLPARTRILREIADDALALYGELLGRGWSEGAAAERVRQVLLPSAPARDALESLHAPLYRRVADRFSPSAMRRWERVALVVMVALAVAGSAAAFRSVPLFFDPSPFLIPVMALGATGALVALVACFRLFVEGAREAQEMRSALAPLLATSGLVGVAAMIGASVDLYRLAARLEAAPARSADAILAFIRADAALLGVGLTLALALGLVWFLLLQWVSAVEAAELGALETARPERAAEFTLANGDSR